MSTDTAHQQPADTAHQEHPIKMYLWVWLLLFILSLFSYLVDYFQIQGALRWTLILIFMFLKAGFIMSIFMHLGFEKLAMKIVVLLPPTAILVLIALMAIEADYTFLTRNVFFGGG